MSIRDEQPGDADAVRAVNDAAFGQTTEGCIVDALRVNCDRLVSLVAVDGDAIVGHILFSPVELRSDAAAPETSFSTRYPVAGMGLAPLAVTPAYQRRGIGSMLVREGLARVRAMGAPYVVVLGHADYYPRFGFCSASTFGVRCPWDVRDESFMLMESQKGALQRLGGVVYYRPEFDAAV
ncbi:MAG: N-acetyltransferase [Candidatus Hydrogenedentes bacterium]|nr:N-acetyltransferase [Candidatus Hydrogenedentota bacterium]